MIHEKDNIVKKVRLLTILFVCAVTIVIIHGSINIKMLCRNSKDIVFSDMIRNIEMTESEAARIFVTDTSPEGVKYVSGINNHVMKNITYKMMYKSVCALGNIDVQTEKMPYMFRNMADKHIYKEIYNRYKSIYKDVKMFPVPNDYLGKIETPYENSWGSAREYVGESAKENAKDESAQNGARKHEGTDIMAGNNERGYFPVISMTDGIVEKKGWLELGGYRIGIRSPGGAYFYYAHLADYADGIEEGVVVKAGDIIGTMGDTGYGKEEGTIGKFDVHLHLGIYLNCKNEDGTETEISYNPYYILKSVEKFKKEFVDNNS